MVGHRPTNDQRSWRTDLINHGPTHRRMGYPLSRPHHVPIGSGTIERTLRRVINRRVRSNGAGWLRENAESVIRIRTRIKAGRTEE